MDNINSHSRIESLSHESVVEQYADLVKRIAHHLMGRLPKHVLLDDLIQAGMMGLLDAANKYDQSKGASFETYAGIRIRGTILDEVRRNDWVPRSVYRHSRTISNVVKTLENKLGRDVRDVEVAAEMGLDLDEYHRLLRDVNNAQVFGFDDIGLTDDFLSTGFSSTIIGPLEGVQKEDFQQTLAELIDALPERERLVLSLYYDEELNLKEIGAVLEVSESRVCQIHAQAMLRLQSRLPEWTSSR